MLPTRRHSPYCFNLDLGKNLYLIVYLVCFFSLHSCICSLCVPIDVIVCFMFAFRLMSLKSIIVLCYNIIKLTYLLVVGLIRSVTSWSAKYWTVKNEHSGMYIDPLLVFICLFSFFLCVCICMCVCWTFCLLLSWKITCAVWHGW